MIEPFKLTLIFALLATIGCAEKSDKSSRTQSDDELIEAMIYHHEFKVSALIDNLASTENIDKKIQTERVAPTTNFWTPLCYASFIGNAKAVRLLIEKGADVHYRDSNGDTPLILAALTGNIEEIEILLRAGADIDEVDSNNRSALIHASIQGNLLTVKYLVENGCQLETKNEAFNALDFAIFYQQQDVVDYLVSIGLTASN